MRLRVLDFGDVSPLRGHAICHGLARAMTAEGEPVLTLGNPASPCVSVGPHQEIEREVDRAYCEAHSLPIIRREVGGGAVYLDRGQMLFNFIYPRLRAPDYAANLYAMFIKPVVGTYRELGIPAEYRPINDIQVAGRKIGGTGAAAIGDATVVGGSFMFDFDIATAARCLKLTPEKFRDKLMTTIEGYMTTMKRELAEVPSRETVKNLFRKHCATALNVTPAEDEPTEAEREAIAAAEEAISDPAWTRRQGRKLVEFGVKNAADMNLTESVYKAGGGLIRAHLLARDSHIAGLMLTGDFTCLPPDGVDDLAARLAGQRLDETSLAAAAASVFRELGLDMPGVAPADIAATIMAAARPPT